MNAILDTRKIEVQEQEAMEQAKALIVLDNPSYIEASNFLIGLKGLQREINETFDPIIKKAHEAHKEANAQKNRHMEPIKSAEELVKGKIIIFQLAEETKRLYAEKQAQEAARKAEEDRRLSEAIEASKNGQAAQAEAILNEPMQAPVVIVPSSVPKISGISKYKFWMHKVVNESAVPRKFLAVDNVKLRAYASAMKEQSNIPGVEFSFEWRVRNG